MEGVHYELDTPAQFWGELDEIIAPVGSSSPTDIDVQSAVRSFVRFAAAFRGTPWCLGEADIAYIGQYLASEEDVEHCCAALFDSQLFIHNADKVRYELIDIAKTVRPLFARTTRLIRTKKELVDVNSLHIIYWVLFLDGQTELETLRKIRKTKCIPTMVNVLWRRARGDRDLQFVTLELMFEVCRSERLGEEDLGTQTSLMWGVNNSLHIL